MIFALNISIAAAKSHEGFPIILCHFNKKRDFVQSATQQNGNSLLLQLILVQLATAAHPMGHVASTSEDYSESNKHA